MQNGDDGKLLRLVYVFLFYLVFGVTEIVLALITVVQSVLNLLGDGPSETLREFGASLGCYVKQITEYLSYTSNEKPFPFSDWPNID